MQEGATVTDTMTKSKGHRGKSTQVITEGSQGGSSGRREGHPGKEESFLLPGFPGLGQLPLFHSPASLLRDGTAHNGLRPPASISN